MRMAGAKGNKGGQRQGSTGIQDRTLERRVTDYAEVLFRPHPTLVIAPHYCIPYVFPKEYAGYALTSGCSIYLQSGELGDIVSVADHLRAAYPEYQRRQRAVFIKQVERAVGQARQKSSTVNSEAQLQVLPSPCPIYIGGLSAPAAQDSCMLYALSWAKFTS